MLCIRKSPVAEKFMDRRVWEVPGFPFKFFYLKASQNAEREPFSLSLISGIENNWMRGWGGVSRLSLESFLSASAENFRRVTLLCNVSEKFR